MPRVNDVERVDLERYILNNVGQYILNYFIRNRRSPDRDIMSAFTWDESPQGYLFWNNLHDNWERLPKQTALGNTLK